MFVVYGPKGGDVADAATVDTIWRGFANGLAPESNLLTTWRCPVAKANSVEYAWGSVGNLLCKSMTRAGVGTHVAGKGGITRKRVKYWSAGRSERKLDSKITVKDD
jgi:hypothetical protein